MFQNKFCGRILFLSLIMVILRFIVFYHKSLRGITEICFVG